MSDMVNNEPADNEKKEHQQEKVIRNELSPGAQLSERRQALNWSIEQVANQLNLAPRQIQAIESDNYAALPGMATARGFIRSYAKLLKVDAAPLLQIVAKEATVAEAALPLRRALPATRFAESRLSPLGKSRLLPRVASAVMVLLILAGGLFATQKIGMHSILPEFMQFGTGNGSAIMAPLGTLETTGKDALTIISDADVDANKYPTSVTSSTAESNIALNEVVASGVTLAARPMAVENAVVVPVARNLNGDGKDILTLKLREDSWVEIKHADDSTMVASLLKAGATESFRITGPVVMTVGNAVGVDATLRGKRVELKPDAKTNVARLKLK